MAGLDEVLERSVTDSDCPTALARDPAAALAAPDDGEPYDESEGHVDGATVAGRCIWCRSVVGP